jgi:hypothetical protein
VLDVLDLGIHDSSTKVQQWAINYLRAIAFQDFALDISTYAPWRAAHLNQTVAQARTASCLAWIDELKLITTADDFARHAKHFRDFRHGLSGSPETAATAAKAGLFEILEPWITKALTDKSLLEPAADSLTLLSTLPISREQLERAIVPLLKPETPANLTSGAGTILGKRTKAWAVPSLLEALRNRAAGPLSGSSIARALAEIGDPSAIPPMIAMIDADNTYDTVYGIGYFGLSPLTGVEYDKSHDGKWWRTWWENNKQRFPEPVRSQLIP